MILDSPRRPLVICVALLGIGNAAYASGVDLDGEPWLTRRLWVRIRSGLGSGLAR